MTQKWKTNQTTSKIHKPHINGKPKRLGTHQYPYLGPKVAVVAEKCDPTVGQLCFCRIFQTVRNLQKRTTRMSLEGLKMLGGRYGSALSGRKMQKTSEPRWRPLPPLPARSERFRRRLAENFYRKLRLVAVLLHGRRVRKVGGRIRLPRLKPERPENGSKRPSSVFKVLGSFSRVLELKMSVLGTRVPFGTQSYVYIGHRVAFR